jgi:hypothetical protein
MPCTSGPTPIARPRPSSARSALTTEVALSWTPMVSTSSRCGTPNTIDACYHHSFPTSRVVGCWPLKRSDTRQQGHAPAAPRSIQTVAPKSGLPAPACVCQAGGHALRCCLATAGRAGRRTLSPCRWPAASTPVPASGGTAACFGRPASRPLRRAASCLAAVRAWPPAWPSWAAAHAFEPSTPASNAGR